MTVTPRSETPGAPCTTCAGPPRPSGPCLWTRNVVEDGVLAACRELGAALVAYSPLGRGFLTGTVQSLAHLARGDFRRGNPRFAEGGLEANLPLLAVLENIAVAHRARPSQIALACVLAQGDDIFPIPGTRRPAYLAENIAAGQVVLSAGELARLDHAFREEAVGGDRYPAAIMPVTR